MKLAWWHKTAITGCIGTATLMAGLPAHAIDSEQQPFDQSQPAALIARPDASGMEQLYKQDLSKTGAPLVKVGGPWKGNGSTSRYNAMGFNQADGFAYALASAWGEGNRNLLRIDKKGTVLDLGPTSGPVRLPANFINSGTILDGRLLVSGTYEKAIYAVDLETRESTRIELTDTFRGADFTSLGNPNVLWTAHDGAVQRVDLTTGKVDTWRDVLPTTVTRSGAVFAYSNGDLGVSSDDGLLTRYEVRHPDSPNPDFEMVSQGPAPASPSADGTAIGENIDVHQPFDPSAPLGFWAAVNDSGTQLHTVDVTASNAPLTPVGDVWTGDGTDHEYNAIAFNRADGYLYGITNKSHTLIRIGSDGTVVEIAEVTAKHRGELPDAFLNNGMIVDGKLIAMFDQSNILLSIDLKTGVADWTDLAAPWNMADFTTNDGVYAWGFFENKVQRLTIETGDISTFENSVTPWIRAGGIINATSGDFIVGDNSGSGTSYRVHVAEPGSAAPMFTLVGTGSVPKTGDADGASTVDAQ